jgi:tight adherence protein B
MIALSVLCAGAAMALMLPARPGHPASKRDEVATPGRWGRWPALGGVAAAGGLLAVAEGTMLALGLILLSASGWVARLVAGVRSRRSAQQREARVVEVCELLAGELRSGLPPMTAVGHCAEAWPDFQPVATAARLGADVPTALRRLSRTPGAAGLRELAAAWVVSQGAGAGLSIALGQVAASARESQSTRRLVVSELSSAQATARLVAAMPLVTLVMGAGVGGDPWGFLLQTAPGLACLAVGLALALLGLTWIERIAWSVMQS